MVVTIIGIVAYNKGEGGYARAVSLVDSANQSWTRARRSKACSEILPSVAVLLGGLVAVLGDLLGASVFLAKYLSKFFAVVRREEVTGVVVGVPEGLAMIST